MDTRLTAWREVSASVLATDRIRQVDRLAVERYGMHSLVLMENAAIGCVHWLRSQYAQPPRTLILCGRGNNGGDGLAIARHLVNCGWPLEVVLQGPVEKLSDDAQANYRILTCEGGWPVQVWDQEAASRLPELGRVALVLDAMLGSGATGDPRPPFAGWIEAVNGLDCRRVAIDLPTGVDAESGHAGNPSFAAETTLTFVARKPAMVRDDAAQRFGNVVVLPIGVPAQLLQNEILAK